MSRMHHLTIVFGFLALGAMAVGCNAEATPQLACLNLCDCSSFSSINEKSCNEECLPALTAAGFDQICIECLAFSTCQELDGPAPCEQECQLVAPPPSAPNNPEGISQSLTEPQ